MSQFRPEMQQRLEQLDKALEGESIRGKIILLATQIDEYLKEMLSKVLKPPRDKRDDELFRPLAPLGSFSAHIAMSHRLGLISTEDAESFDVLRKIRNDCAHAIVPISFASEPYLGRLQRFATLACSDIKRAMAIGGIICPKTDEELAVTVCMIQMACLELTLAKLEQVPDRFYVGSLPERESNER